MLKSLVNFLKREDGPTAVEYAVMLALIIVVCIGAITTLGQRAHNTFNTIDRNLPGAASYHCFVRAPPVWFRRFALYLTPFPLPHSSDSHVEKSGEFPEA